MPARVVEGFTPGEVDPSGRYLVRELNADCLNYLLRLLPPQLAGSTAEFTRTEAFTLELSWEEHLADVALPGGMDRDEIKTLGLNHS